MLRRIDHYFWTRNNVNEMRSLPNCMIILDQREMVRALIIPEEMNALTSSSHWQARVNLKGIFVDVQSHRCSSLVWTQYESAER